jgi:hypothetical protein
MSSGFAFDGTNFNVYGPLIATGNVINNAITNAGSAYTAAIVSMGLWYNYFTVQTLTATYTGAPVMVTCSFNLSITVQSSTVSLLAYVTFELLLDGVVVYSTTGGRCTSGDTLDSGGFCYATGGGAVSFSFLHTPTSASHTYTVRCLANTSQFTVDVSNRFISTIELKK